MDKLIEQLKVDEGFRPHLYKDSVGVTTIGYGTNLDEGLDDEEATFLLQHRAAKKNAELAAALPWVSGLDEVRLASLQNMSYNVGVAGLLKFKRTLAAIQTGRFADAANEMLNSAWAKQVGKRAVRLAEQMKTGEWAT